MFVKRYTVLRISEEEFTYHASKLLSDLVSESPDLHTTLTLVNSIMDVVLVDPTVAVQFPETLDVRTNLSALTSGFHLLLLLGFCRANLGREGPIIILRNPDRPRFFKNVIRLIGDYLCLMELRALRMADSPPSPSEPSGHSLLPESTCKKRKRANEVLSVGVFPL